MNSRDKLRALNADRALRGRQIYTYYRHLVSTLIDHVDDKVLTESIQTALAEAERTPTGFSSLEPKDEPWPRSWKFWLPFWRQRQKTLPS